jgi:ABC-2 type transport system ATP-binding protein
MQTESQSLLTVQGLAKRFRRNRVLQDISFCVNQGEVLGLIGPNGSGKTTLFECLAGLLRANAGSVCLRGQGLRAFERKRQLFYLPDGLLPWPEQSVRFALRFVGGLFAAEDVKISALVGALKLDPLMETRVGALSKGERKRLLLALGLLTNQELLLLDEPFDGLDLRQTRDVMRLLRQQAVEGRTLVLSIHQLVDAERVCDRLVLLSAGRVVGEGSLAQLRAQAHLPEGTLEEIFLALT